MMTSPYTRRPSMHDGDNLGDDAQRNLRRGLAAEVEADRDADTVQLLFANAILAQHLQDRRSTPAASEETDVRHIGGENFLQDRNVELVIVRHENNGRVRIESNLFRQFGRNADADLIRFRKSIARRELRPAVDDDGLKAERLRQRHERNGNRAGAEDE